MLAAYILWLSAVVAWELTSNPCCLDVTVGGEGLLRKPRKQYQLIFQKQKLVNLFQEDQPSHPHRVSSRGLINDEFYKLIAK